MYFPSNFARNILSLFFPFDVVDWGYCERQTRVKTSLGAAKGGECAP